MHRQHNQRQRQDRHYSHSGNQSPPAQLHPLVDRTGGLPGALAIDSVEAIPAQRAPIAVPRVRFRVLTGRDAGVAARFEVTQVDDRTTPPKMSSTPTHAPAIASPIPLSRPAPRRICQKLTAAARSAREPSATPPPASLRRPEKQAGIAPMSAIARAAIANPSVLVGDGCGAANEMRSSCAHVPSVKGSRARSSTIGSRVGPEGRSRFREARGRAFVKGRGHMGE